MMGYGYGGMAWMWPMMLIGMLVIFLIVGVIVYFLYRLVRNSDRRIAGSNNESSTARRILDERYARAEIDEDEYRRRRETLQ
jgi:putative membrane protein